MFLSQKFNCVKFMTLLIPSHYLCIIIGDIINLDILSNTSHSFMLRSPVEISKVLLITGQSTNSVVLHCQCSCSNPKEFWKWVWPVGRLLFTQDNIDTGKCRHTPMPCVGLKPIVHCPCDRTQYLPQTGWSTTLLELKNKVFSQS